MFMAEKLQEVHAIIVNVTKTCLLYCQVIARDIFLSVHSLCKKISNGFTINIKTHFFFAVDHF